ncbi:hypothetical protein [Streptomyces sp. NPDC023588]|uniref:hypothetical protein n=1 Tax=Streptomyces sp. NPDC023588 TaxID=3154907 RepID=UPI003407EC63
MGRCRCGMPEGEDLKWGYPGLSAAVVAEFAAHKVAGLPFFVPQRVSSSGGRRGRRP